MINEMAFSTYHEIIAYELRAALRRYSETWEEVLWKGKREQQLFVPTIEQHRLTVFIFSCALLENAINFYLCLKCNAEQFGKLQKRRC